MCPDKESNLATVPGFQNVPFRATEQTLYIPFSTLSGHLPFFCLGRLTIATLKGYTATRADTASFPIYA